MGRAHVRAHTGVRNAAELRREHVEAFLIDVASRSRPATVSVRYRALQQLFGWLVDEDELERSPMERMCRPEAPQEPVAILELEDVRRLLAACAGRGFADRRDAAIIRLFFDTGMRRAELATLTLADIDLDLDVALVMGKGRRPRSCPFGQKTAAALDRYLRLRIRHPRASEQALWLGERGKGPMTDSETAVQPAPDGLTH